ncbi:hypothetical protein AAF712_015425, partial [Marasmius tenuissimus]
LLTDAKYLHTRLSSLKNVGKLSTMLEIVVQEKRLPGAKVPSSPSFGPPNPSSPQPSPQQQQGKATTSQRLKGLLSGRSVSGSWGKQTASSGQGQGQGNGAPPVEDAMGRRASSSSLVEGVPPPLGRSDSGFRSFEAPASPVPPHLANPDSGVSTPTSNQGLGTPTLNPMAVELSPSPSPVPAVVGLVGVMAGQGQGQGDEKETEAPDTNGKGKEEEPSLPLPSPPPPLPSKDGDGEKEDDGGGGAPASGNENGRILDGDERMGLVEEPEEDTTVSDTQVS